MLAHNAVLYKNVLIKLKLFLLSFRISQVLKQFLVYGRQHTTSVIFIHYTLDSRYGSRTFFRYLCYQPATPHVVETQTTAI